MKRKIMRSMLGVCALAFALTAGSAVVLAGAEEPASPKLTMREGASIRYFAPAGIRFVTDVSEEDYNTVMAGENAEFGALVIPTAVLGDLEIKAENYDEIVAAGAREIVTDLWLEETEAGVKSYASALVGVETEEGEFGDFPEEYYEAELTAVAYCKYDDMIVFAENPQASSMAYTASALLAEGQTNPFLTEITDSVLSEGLEFGADSYTLTVGETAETTLVSGGAEVTLKAVYESDNEEAVAVDENGTLTAKAAGSATITATIGNKTAIVQVISAVSMTASGSFEVEAKGEAETFALDLNADAGKIKGELSSVTLGDKKFSAAEYADGVLTLDRATIADAWGEQIVSAVFLVRENDVVTEALTVELDVLFITRIIENQADFEAMAADGTTALNADKFWYGYYVLANDVDCDYTERGERYPSANWANAVPLPWETDFGFNGVFDGRGYNISGVRTHSLGSVFMGIGSSGVVKNVSFTGAEHKVTTQYAGGFLCSYLHGTIENVYIRFDSIDGGTAFNGGYPINDTLKVKNCFVEAIVADPSTHVGIASETSSAERVPFENVYSVGLGKDAVCDDWGMTNYNVTRNYASREEMAAAIEAGEIDFGDWDRDFWAFDADGLPVPAHMPE